MAQSKNELYKKLLEKYHIKKPNVSETVQKYIMMLLCISSGLEEDEIQPILDENTNILLMDIMRIYKMFRFPIDDSFSDSKPEILVKKLQERIEELKLLPEKFSLLQEELNEYQAVFMKNDINLEQAKSFGIVLQEDKDLTHPPTKNGRRGISEEATEEQLQKFKEDISTEVVTKMTEKISGLENFLTEQFQTINKSYDEIQHYYKEAEQKNVEKTKERSDDKKEVSEENVSNPKTSNELIMQLLMKDIGTFNSAQIYQLRQASHMDIPVEHMRVIANPENSAEKMKELIDFFSSKAN